MMLTVYVIPESGKNHLVSKNVPLRNDSAKAKEICALLTHMVGVSNPTDYGLYSIVDGEGMYFPFYIHCITSLKNFQKYS